MAWCPQTGSHYLSRCWPRSILPYGIIRPQWANPSHVELSEKTQCTPYSIWKHLCCWNSCQRKTRTSITQRSQHCGCWWPRYARSQGIRSHGIDLVLLEYSSLCTTRLNTLSAKKIAAVFFLQLQVFQTQTLHRTKCIFWHKVHVWALRRQKAIT